MAQVQDKNKLYTFLRPYVDWMFRRSYRRIQYVGKENIPTDGACIFSPNHSNALCDAMAILTINSSRKVFVARADIFKNPRQAKLLKWLKIMPINRIRDGVDEVMHNDETINNAVATLRDGVPFCILPEGTHRPMHSLLPLRKGIFRIALRANELFGHVKPVYIVPVGLEYGDYYHLWDDLTVNIGKPINVTQFVKEHPDLDYPQLIMALREELTLRMRELIMWVPDDENYEQNIIQLQANPPAPFNKFTKRNLSRGFVIPLLILLSPLFIVSLALTVPLWAGVLIIRRKVADPAFHNSIQFVWQLIFITLTWCISLPFWLFVQEYMYQIRQLKTKS